VEIFFLCLFVVIGVLFLFIKDLILITKETYKENPYFALGLLIIIFVILYFLLYNKILLFYYLLNKHLIFY